MGWTGVLISKNEFNILVNFYFYKKKKIENRTFNVQSKNGFYT